MSDPYDPYDRRIFFGNSDVFDHPKPREMMMTAQRAMVYLNFAAANQQMLHGKSGSMQRCIDFFVEAGALIRYSFSSHLFVFKLKSFQEMIVRRIRTGVFFQFIGGSKSIQRFDLMIAKFFCQRYPSRSRWVIDQENFFECQKWTIEERFRDCAFEVAVNRSLVPFCEGRSSLTMVEFQVILKIVIDCMKSWEFGLSARIEGEMTSGANDSESSDYTVDCGVPKSVERKMELHQSQDVYPKIGVMIKTLEQYLRK